MAFQPRILWCLAAILVLTGCKHAPSLVGTWKGTVLGVDSTTTFNEDKSLKIDLKEANLGVSLTGTYEVTPKDLSITITDYKLKSVEDAMVPLAKSFMDPLKGKVMKMAYQFNNENEVSLTYQNKTDVLKRDIPPE